MAEQARPQNNLFSILGELFGVGTAEAASPRNPFGNVLPFHRPGMPLGEGGGGFAPRRATLEGEFGRPLAPQGETMRGMERATQGPPPRRFEEIMSRAPDVEKARRQLPRDHMGSTFQEVQRMYKEGLLSRGEYENRLSTIREAQGKTDLYSKHLDRAAKALERGEKGPLDYPASFMERRGAQLEAERAHARAAQEMEVEAAVAKAQQRRMARTQAAEAWLEARRRPREVTPELVREREIERRLGTEVSAPQVNERGFLVETIGPPAASTFVTTNPHNGAVMVTNPGGWGGSPFGPESWKRAQVPFKSRAEALEWASQPRTAKEAAAKADLQRQRLRGMEGLFNE